MTGISHVSPPTGARSGGIPLPACPVTLRPCPRRATMRACVGAILVTIAATLAPACASATDIATLSTRFIPDRPGASTTIAFTIAIRGSDGEPPAPLTGLALHMPTGMEFAESQLGIATCNAVALAARGLAVCPAGSRLGFGHSRVEFAFANEREEAQAKIAVLLGNAPGEGIPILLYVETRSPVVAALVFQSRLLGDSGQFGQQLYAPLPLIPTLPAGPDIQIATLSANFGPEHLTYYRRIGNRSVAFKPRGLSVPRRCPRGGFPMAASLSFADGTSLVARSVVPCPARRAQRR